MTHELYYIILKLYYNYIIIYVEHTETLVHLFFFVFCLDYSRLALTFRRFWTIFKKGSKKLP